jgi:nucleoside 2-deoxyribosyltransferase
VGLAHTPTIKGWQAVEPNVPVGGEKGRCFVAMWFDDKLDSAYESGFRKAIEDCALRAYRVKEDPTNESIPDKILSEITRAQFVVADFTGDRHNVYYEAGFARGIGREVIGCCREDWVKDLKFDTRHLGHVVWKDPDDLRKKLADSIRAIIIPKR